jgi:uncharacterized phage-associated protein
MSLDTKMTAFDHVVFRLTEWYTEEKDSWQISNDLSKLKLTKLLFFTAAITATPDDPGLLNIFDDFAALPYGHVESTVQDHMQNSTSFNITRDGLTYRTEVERYEPMSFADQDVAQRIDNAIMTLKAKNPKLITLNAFDLVDLSHRWQSWITIFALARQNGKLSMPIPKQMIMSEPKFFN